MSNRDVLHGKKIFLAVTNLERKTSRQAVMLKKFSFFFYALKLILSFALSPLDIASNQVAVVTVIVF